MNIINQKQIIAPQSEANDQGQVKGYAAQTHDLSLQKATTNPTLILEWFWLLSPTAETGQVIRSPHRPRQEAGVYRVSSKE